MTLSEVLESHREDVPAAVALVARGDDVEFAAVGEETRQSVFPIASVTKPVVATAALRLVRDGTIGFDDPIATWLPELAAPLVVRTPDAGLDDVVPATAPITVRHLLTSRCGWGFTADFSLPATRKLLAEAHLHGHEDLPSPGEWLERLAGVPLLHQPGDGWTYNTSYDVLGVLLDRVTGSLPRHLDEHLFGPLGMTGTSFLSPALPSGGGGLSSTADDLLAFGRHLLASDLLPELATDTTTAAERAAAEIFLEGQGWGLGGSVDITERDAWNVPGRYGWVGGSGTSFHVTWTEDLVTVLLTRTPMTSPSPLAVMRDFWRSAVHTA
ncbi:CubicO group peptidase, beta-lactamase class C family [Lentzea fradiae]|uniref:CubicO group peptidase, beta-lactamase class C family n=1 Tax=Lentzea fradiae TaxID=200378 RepID=A0A1G7M3N3_9PSEU|nr:serine hydrolase domain-containing protein [Lentzea fradiae]SDF56425.1 CubicO group peptidase, beta-lactamase class C family [Lentzea fradiae]